MKEKDCKELSQKLMELVFRTYYTFRDETREAGDIAVGSHAFGVLTKVYYSEKYYSVNELSVLMHMHNPQLSKILNSIEDAGFIERRRPRENRRSVEVVITEEGKAYVEKMFGIMEAKLAEVLGEKELKDPASAAKMVDQLYGALYVD